MKFKEYLLILALGGAIVLAACDLDFRDDFGTIVSSIVTGYFALSLPREN